MKKLMITTVLCLSLIHCEISDRVADLKASDDSVDLKASDRIYPQLELDGTYLVHKDLIRDFIPIISQSYNIDIASNTNDVIIKIESAKEGEKNILCSLFHNAEKNWDNQLIGRDVVHKISSSNNKHFIDKVVYFSPTMRRRNVILSTSKHLVVGKGEDKSVTEIFLFDKSDKEAKSYKTIKEECSRLQTVN